MVTIEQIIARVDVHPQLNSRMDRDGDLHITVEDFAGFDEHWDEQLVEVDVEDFLDWLEEEANEVEGDLYEYYYFDGFTVIVGYESFDI